MDRFGCFFSSLTSQPTPAASHNRTKYQKTTCAMQFSPCLFLHGFCPVFQHAERDTCSRLCLAKVFNKVGWYGKNCLFSLWILVVKSAVRIWIGLDGFFPSLTSQPKSSTTQPHKIPANNLRNAILTMLVLAWVLFLFSNMLKDTHAVDYVGQSFQ